MGTAQPHAEYLYIDILGLDYIALHHLRGDATSLIVPSLHCIRIFK